MNQITFEQLKSKIGALFPSAFIREYRINYDLESVIDISYMDKRFHFFGVGKKYEYIPLGWDSPVKMEGFRDDYPERIIKDISKALSANADKASGTRFSIGIPLELELEPKNP